MATASPLVPDTRMEIAFSTPPDDLAPNWIDVTNYVEAVSGLTIDRGREDELSAVQPSRLTVTLDNTDGRFTPGNASGAYYPNVKLARMARVSTLVELIGNTGFETDTNGWTGVAFTLATTTSQAHSGIRSMEMTRTAGAGSVGAETLSGVNGFPVLEGREYVCSAWFRAAATPRSCQYSVEWFTAAGSLISTSSTSATDSTSAWTEVTQTVTAPATAAFALVRVTPLSAASTEVHYVDDVSLKMRVRRFTGYIDEWPVQWPNGTDEYSSVTITASSRQARLSSDTELRSIIDEEILEDSPLMYYPLGEEERTTGATKAGDVSGNQSPNLSGAGSGTAITWQGATGPTTDGISAPLFNAGRYLEFTAPSNFINAFDDSVTLECFFTSSGGAGANRALVGLWTVDQYWSLELEAGEITGIGGTHLGSLTFNMFQASPLVNDGEVHHAALRGTRNGTTIDMSLFLDGVEVDTDTNPHQFMRLFDRLDVGAYVPASTGAGNKHTGMISHVTVYSGAEVSDARIAAHAEAGLTGFSGDSTDERILRFVRYAGINPSLVDVETGSTTAILNQEITGQTAIDLMQEVTDTENVLLFDAADGDLTFHARSHRQGAAVAFTLDASQQHIEANIEAKMDSQLLVNDLTAVRPDSANIRAVNETSIENYGLRRGQIDLLTTDDDEATDAVNWRMNRYTEPGIRIHSVTVDLLNSSSSLITSLLAAELGDRITLDNLPSQAPATSIDGFIEGINEQIGPESYFITFELSPASQSDVWVLDSAIYSQLDESTILGY